MHECARSCLTLWDPMDRSPPGSSVHGVLQARILEWVAMPSSRGSSWPRGRTWVSCTGGRFFTTWATREALRIEVIFFNSSYLHVVSFLFPLMTEWHLFEGGLEVLGKTCPLFHTTGQKPPAAFILGHHSATTWSNYLAQWLGTLHTSVQALVQNTHCKKQSTTTKKTPLTVQLFSFTPQHPYPQ